LRFEWTRDPISMPHHVADPMPAQISAEIVADAKLGEISGATAKVLAGLS